jgi:hypothetical protein
MIQPNPHDGASFQGFSASGDDFRAVLREKRERGGPEPSVMGRDDRLLREYV